MTRRRSHRRLIRVRNALRRLLDIVTAPAWAPKAWKEARHGNAR